MGFGRKWLDGILTDDNLSPKEKANAIMDEHLSQMNEVKDERDSLKKQASDAEAKAADLQKQLDDANGGEDFKSKYEQEHTAFEEFKKKTASDAVISKVKAAHRKILQEMGISDKRIDAIQKVTDFTKLKLDKDDDQKLDDEAAVRKAINDEWSEFIPTVKQQGASVAKPPQQSEKSKMTKDEILAITDRTERQQKIFENKELFGIV